MEEIKPCPVCGDKAYVITSQDAVFAGEFLWRVVCIGCRIGTCKCVDEKQAIAAWNQRVDGWISVDEELPEIGETVEVCGSYCGDVEMGCFIGTPFDKNEWYLLEYGMVRCDVTHWRPLPSPPTPPAPEACDLCVCASQMPWSYCPRCGRPLDRLRDTATIVGGQR
jgi:hypothetical protein